MTKTSPFGRPLEDFLLDPPIPVPEEMRLSATGVMLFESPFAQSLGTRAVQVANHVGVEHYPNVADYIEEGRRFGFSTRAEGVDLTLLEPGLSYLWHAHPKAFIVNYQDYLSWECPKCFPHHAWDFRGIMPPMCLGVVWEDLEGTEAGIGDFHIRTMPAFHYTGHPRPEGVTPDYLRAFFLRLPIHGIEVVKAEDGSHEKKLERLRAAKLPVMEVDE